MAEVLLAHHADLNARNSPMNGECTPLYLAAVRGNVEMMKLLIARGADVNAKSTDGSTPLSAVRGNVEMMKLLIARGADVNAKRTDGSTPLSNATGRRELDSIKTLLAAKADPDSADNKGRTPLSYAAESGSPEMVKMLLGAKADPNGGKLDAPLLCAIHKQDASSAELLLQAGANPNAKGEVDWQPSWNWHVVPLPPPVVPLQIPVMSPNRGSANPLWLAVDTKQFPIVQLLLKFKADPNDTQIGNWSLLFGALGNTNILEALLDAGAKPDAHDKTVNEGETPLEYASREGNAAAVELLLRHGADPNYSNVNGNTPLHYAAFSDAPSRNVFEPLLGHHANPNVRNNQGKTPLDYLNAKMASSDPTEKETASQLAELLRQHGALDNLPNWDRITVSRPSTKYSSAILFKGTNDWNQFTLYDLLGVQYDLLTASPRGVSRVQSAPYGYHAMANSLSFPDFTRIVIHRPSASGTNWNELKINLARPFDSGDCAGDVPLQFGDVVEIPEADHVMNEPWPGLSTNELFTLKNCLSQHLQIIVNGQTTNITLAPQITMTPNVVHRVEEGPITLVSLLKFEPFMLWPVLENSKLLLASSDLSRVTVKRHEGATGKTREWTVDCSNPNSPPNFWLRDGDVIEVPEKP